jgi:hypothetical protein
MMMVYDIRAGVWVDDDEDEDGPGRGGCRRPPRPAGGRDAPTPRLALGLQPVVREAGPLGRYGR